MLYDFIEIISIKYNEAHILKNVRTQNSIIQKSVDPVGNNYYHSNSKLNNDY